MLRLLVVLLLLSPRLLAGDGVRVGAAAVNLKASDHMEVAKCGPDSTATQSLEPVNVSSMKS